jgi:hypothetical protein
MSIERCFSVGWRLESVTVTGKEENQNMFYVSVSSTQTLENSIAG